MLDDIKCPEYLRGYDATDLSRIADELRSETIKSVAVTGCRGSGLDVIELPVALRHVFDTPRGRLIREVVDVPGRYPRRDGQNGSSVASLAHRQVAPRRVNGPDETTEFRLPPELASVSSLPRLPTALARPLGQG
ncbi:MAG TPA: 1-deoxy-D-xylulose-5-phosphate synthase N-terminal domain-containing protein [Roseiarcus sp.]|jgi:hypothetical protein